MPETHKHIFIATPSYIITSGLKVESVYMCQNKADGYCYEHKREVKDV